MARKSPALDKATMHLDAAVRAGEAAGRLRLPPIVDLAHAAGVSSLTMWKAVRRLTQTGKLRAAPQRGIVIVAGTPSPPDAVPAAPSEPVQPSWERVRDLFRADLLRGVYRAGSQTPSPKELVRRYGVSHRTLRRALASLVDTQMLLPFKRSYRVPGLAVDSRDSTIVLIAFAGVEYPQPTTPRTIDHIRALESECSRIGVKLETYSHVTVWDELFASGKVEAFAAPHKSRAIRGFLVWAVGAYPPYVIRTLEYLGRLGRPVAILDETATFGGHDLPPDLGAVRVYDMATGPLSGHAVGRYMLNLGHRHIVYISAGGRECARGKGVRKAFADAGLPGGVFCTPCLEAPPSSLLGPGRTLEDVLVVTRHDDGPTTLRPGVDFQESLFSYEAKQQYLNHVRFQLEHPHFEEIFEVAAGRSEATAWVCYNDNIAIQALAYLRRRKARVPEDVSVVGFDDCLEAAFCKLSSYNFNGAAVIHQMVADVLGGRIRRQVVYLPEMEGFVNERASTGRPRTAR